MMKVKIFGVDVSFSFIAVAFLALALISDKNGTFIICLVSSVFHEIGHIIALKLTGADLKSVKFNLGDVAINADSSKLTYIGEIIVTLSGVAVNVLIAGLSFALSVVFSAEVFTNLLIVNLIIFAFNMLPVKFLDGGHLLMLILQKYLSERITDRILTVLTILFIIPVAITGFIFVLNSSYNFSLLFAALYLICTLVSKEFRNVS